MRISELFQQQILNEALTDIDDAVDLIYDVYFRKTVEAIRADKFSPQLVAPRDIPARQFENVIIKRLRGWSKMKEAWDVNPVNFTINSPSGNSYVPSTRHINLSLNPRALSLLKPPYSSTGSVRELDQLLSKDDVRKWFNDISEAKVKGSINHELAHYIDDTLNGQHIRRRLSRLEFKGATNPKAYRQYTGGFDDVYVSDIEIEAQIHNVYQLKRQYAAKWNSLTFTEMLFLDPSLIATYDRLKRKNQRELEIWKKKMRARMARENLLGDWMRYD